MPGVDAQGKLEPGDRITQVNGEPPFADSPRTLSERVNESRGAPVSFTIERVGQARDVPVQPREDRDAAGRPMWRVGLPLERQPRVYSPGLIDAAWRALRYPVEQAHTMGKALYGILFGRDRVDLVVLIRIAEFDQASATDVVSVIKLLLMVWVHFGLLNLLPIPPFDGGRLMFLAYEIVTGRCIHPTIEPIVYGAGITALVLVMLIVLYIDIRRTLS